MKLTLEEIKVANEFLESKWLWWVNKILHTFGWSIVYHYNDTGEILYYISIAKNVEYRGFVDDEDELHSYQILGTWLSENIEEANKAIL